MLNQNNICIFVTSQTSQQASRQWTDEVTWSIVTVSLEPPRCTNRVYQTVSNWMLPSSKYLTH